MQFGYHNSLEAVGRKILSYHERRFRLQSECLADSEMIVFVPLEVRLRFVSASENGTLNARSTFSKKRYAATEAISLRDAFLAHVRVQKHSAMTIKYFYSRCLRG